MQLIIILGLIAKLALVSSDCEVGKVVSNFHYNKVTGIWYFVYHEANKEEDKLDCTYVNIYGPRNSSGNISLHYYNDSIKSDVERSGTVRDFDNTGFELEYGGTPICDDRVYFAAVDYKGFCIAKICSRELRTLLNHVGFRERYPDEATLNDAKEALSDNGIAFDTLKSWNSSRCENYP